MDRSIEKRTCERVVALGESGQATAVAELLPLLESASGQVRRLAVSALGKLAGIADAAVVVPALQQRLADLHPQVRQYAVKALSVYGADAGAALSDLRDMCANPREKLYNHRDAAKAIERIEEATRIAEEQAVRRCRRCQATVSADEYARSMRAFDRIFCDACFDEVYLSRRNFDTKVELEKIVRAGDGTLVQSQGERMIAEYLSRRRIVYRYDERIRILQGFAIRPDFYLPEFDVYIEYWGMDTIDYQIGMLHKKKLYQQQGKRLVSVYREDCAHMDAVLDEKLGRYLRTN